MKRVTSILVVVALVSSALPAVAGNKGGRLDNFKVSTKTTPGEAFKAIHEAAPWLHERIALSRAIHRIRKSIDKSKVVSTRMDNPGTLWIHYSDGKQLRIFQPRQGVLEVVLLGKEGWTEREGQIEAWSDSVDSQGSDNGMADSRLRVGDWYFTKSHLFYKN